ncbi:MAG: putative cytosol aminopeptidase [Hyphococcus sp.]|nr:MAG: putative cytosol aminopeptidase [Marinicaulis sp.]
MRNLFLIIVVLFSAGAAQISSLAARDIDFSATPVADGALIFAISDAENLTAVTAIIGEANTENLKRAMTASGFMAEEGTTASFISGGATYGEIYLVGVKSDGMRPRDWEDFGGRAATLAKASKTDRIYVVAPGASDADIENAAFGAMLGQYSFTKYMTEAEAATGELLFVSDSAAAVKSSFDAGRRHVAEAVNWARDLQTEPANALYPEEFVRRSRLKFNGVAKTSMSVLDVRAMERLGMGAILGVGRGSERPPRMMIVRYNGGAAGEKPLVFAGKGITFDSGGISIKTSSNMWEMKGDMSGAAAVTGAVLGLAKSRAPVNVIAIAALAENMPDGRAIRPGDVLKAMSGTTIEIMSTDAEGRLVLSDALWYAQQEFDPALLVDVATLTGSVIGALNDEYGGLFARSDDVAEMLLQAGETSGDDVWRLPLHPNHKKQIKSVIADIKNGNTGSPGASTGAQFLGTFVKEETPWAHLDIAGVEWFKEMPEPTKPMGATGWGVRLLDRLARDYEY